MFTKSQLAIAGILVLAALFALLILPGSWATIAIIELVVVYIVVTTLATRIPAAIRKGMERNCKRSDGSLSPGRVSAELAAVRKLKSDLLFTVLLLLIPTNILLWYVHNEVVPLSLGLDAIASFRVDEDEWKSGLADEEQDFDRWAKSKGVFPTTRENHKRLLWRLWPMLIIAGLVWVVIAFRVLAFAYQHSLKELQTSINIRAQHYGIRDT